MGTRSSVRCRPYVYLNVAKVIAMTDSTGTLEKALERNLLKAKHDRSIALLDLTLGELLGYPFNFNETRIPRRRKCFRRVCAMQR